MKSKNKYLIPILIVSIIMLVSSCAPATEEPTAEEPQEPTEDEATEGDGETSDYTLTLGLGGYEHAAEEIREQMDKAA